MSDGEDDDLSSAMDDAIALFASSSTTPTGRAVGRASAFIQELRERATFLGQLAASLIIDALFVLLWVGVAWLTEYVRNRFNLDRVDSDVANIVQILLVGGTLLLVIVYVGLDVFRLARRMWQRKDD
jgi:hypothetical protein